MACGSSCKGFKKGPGDLGTGVEKKNLTCSFSDDPPWRYNPGFRGLDRVRLLEPTGGQMRSVRQNTSGVCFFLR